MHPYVAAAGITAVLILAGAALSSGLAPGADALHEARALEGNPAPASRGGHGHGGGAHAWTGGTGSIPTLSDALLGLERRRAIVIESDAMFNPENGVRSGSGSLDDPFVISGWFVDTLYVHDTTLAFEIKGNYIADILILDWTGQGGYVHHNHIDNLRTNRNVPRTGDPTAAVIEKNLILRVEELRHFDGVLAHNTIGDPDRVPLLERGVVLNIAGLNGAGIHHNVVHGGVDMKLHGHHHSDAPGAHSHNHGQPDAAQAEDHVEDHQVRHIDFLFANNTIRDVGFGLRYNDLAHAADDRQATSEQEPDLEKPHVHHTTIRLVGNLIEGATLRVQVLSAPDDRHLPGQSATLVVADNRIVDPVAGDGIKLVDVSDAAVSIHGNRVERGDLQLGQYAAILLAGFRNSTIEVGDNKFGAYRYGVRATAFDELTRWSVAANDASGVKYPVYWDDTVPNPPEGMADGTEAADGHEHDHGDGAPEGPAAEAVPSLAARARR